MDIEPENAFKVLGSLVTEGFTIINKRLDKVESQLDKVESELHYIRNDTNTIPELFKLIKEQDEDINTLKAHIQQ